MARLFRRLHQVHVGFVGIVQEGHQLIILPVWDGIVFVGVTLGAPDGEPQPRGAGGGHAIGHGMETELERIDPALFIEHGVPVETGGDALVSRGVGQEVPRELFQSELVEGHVGIERADHPIAPRPDASSAILFVPVGVGVPGQIHPATAPAFTVARGSQELIHPVFVACVAGVLQEGLYFRRGGR